MQFLLSFVSIIYLVFYVFEGVIRYGFHLVGKDGLIFMRDVILFVPIVILFIQQFLHRKINPAYIIFILIVLIHGLVMFLNTGSFIAVVYSAKMLMTLLVGTVLADRLFQPSRTMLAVFLIMWSVSMLGIMIDKYYVEFPWMGLKTTIDDVQVEISRDWQISGDDKRAGGFMRSSINAATIMPLLALILMFHLRRLSLRILVALLTVPALIWTTQKGPVIAYILTLAMLSIAPLKPIPVLRVGVWIMLILMVGLPVILSGASMPPAKGVFSFSSFYQRIEEMWPQAWTWIHNHEAFPFGVGLGGIGGAQRLYAPKDVNAADNMFILMYAYFGMMSFIYLGFIGIMASRIKSHGSTGEANALAVLVYLLGYGCVISILEDQMAALFLGASVAFLCREIQLEQYQNTNNFLSQYAKVQL